VQVHETGQQGDVAQLDHFGAGRRIAADARDAVVLDHDHCRRDDLARLDVQKAVGADRRRLGEGGDRSLGEGQGDRQGECRAGDGELHWILSAV
jgi:hypothetical protein